MISIKLGIYLLLLFLYICFVIRQVCRFRYGGKLKEEIEKNRKITEASSKLQAQIERLEKEKDELLTDNCFQRAEVKLLNAENKRLEAELENEKEKSKTPNDVIQVACEADKKDEPVLEKESDLPKKRKPFFNTYPPSGISFEEIDSMVQVMHGKSVSDEVRKEAVMGVWKTEDTHLFDALLERINGALPEVEKALNDFKKKKPKVSVSDWENFDIRDFMSE